ncbi:MAG TPA: ATP-binding protein [Candidatus Aminicenantes bacterium]|nr:ATP-binding protein [Candidatus Aminicenantes bacterium]
MIERQLLARAFAQLGKGKAVLILGPRQSGKTTLLRMIAARMDQAPLWLDCDEPDERRFLENATSTALSQRIGEKRLVLIDEAQRVSTIGLTLKLLVDKMPAVQVVASGSSSFGLGQAVREPLTGRAREFHLLPLAAGEMVRQHGAIEERRLLEVRLRYGMYPEVVLHPGEERDVLRQLATAYLYKDVFSVRDLRRPEFLQRLVEALALQVGREVSYHELGRTIGADSVTIGRYITLLEEAFVVFRLRSFSRNARNELKKSRKIYFYDNGVRNALIGNFQPPELRPDLGALWENFLVSERIKMRENAGLETRSFFWRTAQQQEIDYLEETNGRLDAAEFKWRAPPSFRLPRTFTKAYPDHTAQLVSPENYLTWLAAVAD